MGARTATPISCILRIIAVAVSILRLWGSYKTWPQSDLQVLFLPLRRFALLSQLNDTHVYQPTATKTLFDHRFSTADSGSIHSLCNLTACFSHYYYRRLRLAHITTSKQLRYRQLPPTQRYSLLHHAMGMLVHDLQARALPVPPICGELFKIRRREDRSGGGLHM